MPGCPASSPCILRACRERGQTDADFFSQVAWVAKPISPKPSSIMSWVWGSARLPTVPCSENATPRPSYMLIPSLTGCQGDDASILRAPPEPKMSTALGSRAAPYHLGVGVEFGHRDPVLAWIQVN